MERDLDKLFREKLANYASETPTQVWGEVSNALVSPDKSKKERLFWIMLFLIALVLLAIFLWYPKPRQESLPDPLAGKASIVEPFQRNLSGPSSSIHPVFDLPGVPLVAMQAPMAGHSVAGMVKEISSSYAKDELPGPMIASSNFPDRANESIGSDGNHSETGYSPDFSRQLRCVNPVVRPAFAGLYSGRKPHFRSKTLGDCFDGPRSRYMVGFNASIDYPFRSMNLIGQGELAPYLDQRRDTEASMPSFNAGFVAGYFHSSGLLIKSGVQYTQINERFLYVKENVIKIQTHITIDTMYNTDGSYSIHRDTSILEVLGRDEMRTLNQFRMLDIPLILGYNFDLARFNIDVNAGVILNITSASTGRIFNENLLPSYYGRKGTGDFNPFARYYGVSLYGGMTFLSPVTDRLQFYLEPNVRYYLKSFSSSQYPIRQKYLVAGLSTGFRYYF